ESLAQSGVSGQAGTYRCRRYVSSVTCACRSVMVSVTTLTRRSPDDTSSRARLRALEGSDETDQNQCSALAQGAFLGIATPHSSAPRASGILVSGSSQATKPQTTGL